MPGLNAGHALFWSVTMKVVGFIADGKQRLGVIEGDQVIDLQAIDPYQVWQTLGWQVWSCSYFDYTSGVETSDLVFYNPDTDETFFKVRVCCTGGMICAFGRSVAGFKRGVNDTFGSNEERKRLAPSSTLWANCSPCGKLK